MRSLFMPSGALTLATWFKGGAMGNIGYHTREHLNHTRKVSGGCFGGGFDLETVNRLVKAHYKVVVSQSGRLVFVDRHGVKVSLYVTVDPIWTDAGKAAQAEHNAQMAKELARRHAEESELNEILDGMSTQEALRLLKGEG